MNDVTNKYVNILHLTWGKSYTFVDVQGTDEGGRD